MILLKYDSHLQEILYKNIQSLYQTLRLINDLGFNLYIVPSISHLVTNSENLGIERDECSSEYYNYLLIDILVLT